MFCIFINVLKVNRYKKEVKMKLEIGQFVHKVGSSVLVSKDKQISMKDLIKKNENFLKMRVT